MTLSGREERLVGSSAFAPCGGRRGIFGRWEVVSDSTLRGKRKERRSVSEELLEDAIEDEVEARARYLQLIEMTPNRRLKATFSSLAAGEAAHAQLLQQLHRAYAGVVYEPHREAIASLKPGQVLDDSALLQGLNVAVEAERKAFMGYRAIAERYPSQPDVVRQMLVLARSDLPALQRHERHVQHTEPPSLYTLTRIHRFFAC